MSGTGGDISQVHWKQQWLENGTLFFHVSMSSSEQLTQVTQPTVREPPRVLHEHMHLLHISVMGGLIALLLLILLFTLVLYTRQRWCRRRRAPQKSASTEATHEIHYIPSVLLGPAQNRDSFRGARPLQHSSVIGMPIRETPILDDCDCEEDEQPGHLLDGKARLDDDLCSQGTHNMDSLGKAQEKKVGQRKKAALKWNQESVEALMQRFKESFRTNTTMEITHFQNVTHSSSTGRKRGPTHTRGFPWPYSNLEKGYDLVTGEQAPEKIFRSSYSLGQGLWLPVTKSFVVPPVELSINPIASCKTDVLVTEDPGEVREEAIMSTYFETVDDLLASFGPVRDCSKDNGGCRKNFKCVSDRRMDSTGCMCPDGLRPMKDGSGCYDYSLGTDCTDGFNGGCEQLCLQQLVPLPEDPTSSNVLMFCGCVQEYKLAADGRSCLLLADHCEGPKCPKQDSRFNNTLFSEMLHGYNNKSQQLILGQVFQMTFRDNNFIKDFPQLADGLMVIPLPVEEQCRGVLSEPLPNLQLLSGDAQFSEATGYPMMQQWRVRSNLYKVKLSAITLSTDFSKVLKSLTADSTRDDLLAFIQQYGSHYISEALYGSELTCNIYFPSKKSQQQLWLQYQKEVTEQGGGRRDLKAVPFISYLSSLLKTQLLSDDLVAGVEIRCQEKGSCPAACHLCRQSARETSSPTPVLLEVSRVVPLYSLVQDNSTKEAFKSATMSSYWCAGKGDVIENWCRCDLTALGKDGLPNCSPLRRPVLRLAPHLEPSSTMVALEWIDVEPLIGYKVSDYIIQHKRVEDPSEAEIYTGEVLSLMDDLFSGLGSSCVVAGRRNAEHPHNMIYSLVFKCLEPDSLYKFSLYAVDSRGSRSDVSFVSVRTSCPMVDDSKAEEIADKVYNLYNGYTSGKEQQTAYNTLMEISPPLLYRVQHHYNSHYEKFGDFVWRSEDELGPRKAHLILKRTDRISLFCRSLLRSGFIQSRTESVPYLLCRNEDSRPSSSLWHSALHESRLVCLEKLISVQRNIYGKSKLR
ncbi:astrotactin-2-like [Danio aesculapii]|uniref:astrotactin-2-like n=1 Tax=Danio aesculapii TaxID=1142201 RepID=UPI0024C0A99E|nr:astrotactin-2-like [Danio aesculapii]